MKKVFLFILAIFCALTVFAQKGDLNLSDPIKADPNVTIGKLDNGLTYYIRKNTYPKNRVFVQARAAIAGPEKVVETTTDIKVYYNGSDLSGATITAAVAGVPIDGGQLSVVNQNGNIIYDTNGHAVTGAYAVTSGGEYFSINSLGRNMIIKNTGGVSKQVTIKVTALNKTKEISFAVKAGG